MSTRTDLAVRNYLVDLQGLLSSEYNNKKFRASGNWRSSLKIVGSKLEMAGYTEFIIENRQGRPYKGRRPTRRSGSGTVRERILAWISQKGIKGRDERGRFITNESLSWAISTSIHQKGTVMFKNPQAREGIDLDGSIAIALDRNMPQITDALTEDITKQSGLIP